MLKLPTLFITAGFAILLSACGGEAPVQTGNSADPEALIDESAAPTESARPIESAQPADEAAALTPPPVDERPALPFFSEVELETVCGILNDQQDVETYDGTLDVTRPYVDQHEKSTVQLQWRDAGDIEDRLGPGFSAGNVGGRRWCTGTLISENRVLTAGHCFDPQNNRLRWITPFRQIGNGSRESVPPEVIATLQQVNFNYQVNGLTGATRPGTSVGIARLVEHRVGDLDFAIVELESSPDRDLASIATVGSRLPMPQEPIAMIQHPQGYPKKIDTGNVRNFLGSEMFYGNLDTHGGSSGSGIRDATGAIIGVHTNGGCTVSSGANRGVTITAIRDASNAI